MKTITLKRLNYSMKKNKTAKYKVKNLIIAVTCALIFFRILFFIHFFKKKKRKKEKKIKSFKDESNYVQNI